MFSTPTVAGELLLIGSCAGTFYAFDKRTGKVAMELQHSPRWEPDQLPRQSSNYGPTSFHWH